MGYALHRNRLGRRLSAGLPELETAINQFFRSEGAHRLARASFHLGS